MPTSQNITGFPPFSFKESATLPNPTKDNISKEGGPIVFFCAEYAIDNLLPIYAGGLGILAGDFLVEASESNTPFIAIGLFYRKGYASYPKISDEDEILDPRHAGFAKVLDKRGEPIMLGVSIQGREVYFESWVKKWGTAELYLLDPNISKNTEADRKIATYLYPDSFDGRMSQEMILGIGGVKLLRALGVTPSVYHLNEGHTSFVVLALALEYLKENPDVKTLGGAIEGIREKLVGTKHTILPGAGIFFTKADCKKYLESYWKESGVGEEEFFNLGTEGDLGIFSTSRFLLKSVSRANAVSQLHAQFEKETYPESQELLPITNGVSETRWMLSSLKEEVSDEKLWDIHVEAKKELVHYIKQIKGGTLNPDALTIVWARRIAEYKRPLLIFEQAQKLVHILKDTERPINIIISGNAYSGDPLAIRLLQELEVQIKNLNEKNIIYLAGYSIDLARKLVAGADVWLNTPVKGQEASGTSSMKAGLNGVLQLSVPDGWYEEVRSYDCMWSLQEDSTAESFYTMLEKEIIPLFYKRDKRGYPPDWISRMRKTREVIRKKYTSKRMFEEYKSRLYFPEGLRKTK